MHVAHSSASTFRLYFRILLYYYGIKAKISWKIASVISGKMVTYIVMLNHDGSATVTMLCDDGAQAAAHLCVFYIGTNTHTYANQQGLLPLPAACQASMKQD